MKKISKTGKFLKKNVTSLIVFMILLILVLAGILVISVLLPTTKISKYGDRLEGINEVLVTSERLTDIESKLVTNESLEAIDMRLSGRIINIEIILKKDVTKEKGKEISELFLAEFNKNEKDFYDFQVFLKIDTDKKYTVIGYKVPKSEKISWTNN